MEVKANYVRGATTCEMEYLKQFKMIDVFKHCKISRIEFLIFINGGRVEQRIRDEIEEFYSYQRDKLLETLASAGKEDVHNS